MEKKEVLTMLFVSSPDTLTQLKINSEMTHLCLCPTHDAVSMVFSSAYHTECPVLSHANGKVRAVYRGKKSTLSE